MLILVKIYFPNFAENLNLTITNDYEINQQINANCDNNIIHS